MRRAIWMFAAFVLMVSGAAAQDAGGGDAGNAQATAMQVAVNMHYSGQLASGADEDWYKFPVNQHESVEVDVTLTSQPAGNVKIEFWGDKGQGVEMIDQKTLTTNGDLRTVSWWTPPQTTTGFLRVYGEAVTYNFLIRPKGTSGGGGGCGMVGAEALLLLGLALAVRWTPARTRRRLPRIVVAK